MVHNLMFLTWLAKQVHTIEYGRGVCTRGWPDRLYCVLIAHIRQAKWPRGSLPETPAGSACDHVPWTPAHTCLLHNDIPASTQTKPSPGQLVQAGCGARLHSAQPQSGSIALCIPKLIPIGPEGMVRPGHCTVNPKFRTHMSQYQWGFLPTD